MKEPRQELESMIKETYVDSGEYEFKDENEADRFVKNSAYYVEKEYKNEGHHQYQTLKEFSNDWRTDAIIYGVSTHDYRWFL